LNFHPDEKLQDALLAGISTRYAEMMGLENQPLLVYKHTDAGHPHVHLVSNLIDSAGKRISIRWPVYLFSKEACKKIEEEYGLLSGPVRGLGNTLSANATAQKIRYGETPLRQSMEQVLRKVLSEFHFGSLEDFNVLLRQYNLYADRRSENSKTFRYGGLVYQALDGQGKRIGVPVKASALETRPNLQQIIRKIEESKSSLMLMMDSVKARIDWSLLQVDAGWDQLMENLQQEDIHLMSAPRQTSETEAVFLDLRQKAVFRSTELGPAFSIAAMKTRMEFYQGASRIFRSNTCLSDPDYASYEDLPIEGEEESLQRPSVSDSVDPLDNSIPCIEDHFRRTAKR
jgi:hypothetical protein